MPYSAAAASAGGARLLTLLSTTGCGGAASQTRPSPLVDAYQEVLSHTSTEWAPWHVIPADRKWYARLAAGAVILHEVMRIDPRYPEVSDAKRDELAEIRDRLAEDGRPQRNSHRARATATAAVTAGS